MGIDLGCGEAAVAEQLLYAPQVGAAVEQVGGKAAAEGVRAGPVADPEAGEVLVQQPADAPGRQPGAEPVEEDGRLARPLRRPQPDPAAEPRGGHRADRAEPLAPAFAADA